MTTTSLVKPWRSLTDMAMLLQSIVPSSRATILGRPQSRRATCLLLLLGLRMANITTMPWIDSVKSLWSKEFPAILITLQTVWSVFRLIMDRLTAIWIQQISRTIHPPLSWPCIGLAPILVRNINYTFAYTRQLIRQYIRQLIFTSMDGCARLWLCPPP